MRVELSSSTKTTEYAMHISSIRGSNVEASRAERWRIIKELAGNDVILLNAGISVVSGTDACLTIKSLPSSMFLYADSCVFDSGFSRRGLSIGAAQHV